MSQKIRLVNRFGFRLGGIAILTTLICTLLVAVNFYTVSSLQKDTALLALYLKGRMYCFQAVYLTRCLDDAPTDQRAQTARELARLIDAIDERYQTLEKGDAERNIAPLNIPEALSSLRSRKKEWEVNLKPLLQSIVASPSAEISKRTLETLDRGVVEWAAAMDKSEEIYQAALSQKVAAFNRSLIVFTVFVFTICGFLIGISRAVVRRVYAIATTAHRIAEGNLSLRAEVRGADELAALSEAFNCMTGNLQANIQAEQEGRARIEKLLVAEREGRERIEQLINNISDAVHQLSSSSAEILASTTQQAVGAQEQGTAVTETITTVNEVAQTAEQAAIRAKSVGEAVQRTVDISEAGRTAVEDSISVMNKVRTQVDAIAENILALAEQAQTIGEIIMTVNDVAEQTNLLALNAAIEASRAGDEGKGFSVVAAEIKELAGQCKKATSQVRQILGHIQKATNMAVISTEQGTKSSVEATRVVGQAGETIRALTETLSESAQAAAQIAASAGQQSIGMAQVNQAMKNIDQVTKQNIAAIRQIEEAAQNLNSLSRQLSNLVTTRPTEGPGRTTHNRSDSLAPPAPLHHGQSLAV